MSKKKYTYSQQSMAELEASSSKRDAKYLKEYSAMKKKYNLSDNGVAAIHQIVNICMGIQGEICGMADFIKIDKLKAAQAITEVDDVKITKDVFIEMVKIASRHKDSKVTQKSIDKYKTKCNTRLYSAALRKSFFMTYFKDDTSISLIDNRNIKIEKVDLNNSDDFYSILNDAARIRYYIDKVLYKEYHDLAKATMYLTGGKMDYARLKKLVDYEYYSGNGEKGQYHDKALVDIKKLLDTYKMYDAYGFSYMKEIFRKQGWELKRIANA